ncbi:MAG: hypothetical protein Q8O89_08945, partial [Nanoarchaeota archaeon]|nr:hypothetical protein [Nanoarchaeota archaeon]
QYVKKGIKQKQSTFGLAFASEMLGDKTIKGSSGFNIAHYAFCEVIERSSKESSKLLAFYAACRGDNSEAECLENINNIQICGIDNSIKLKEKTLEDDLLLARSDFINDFFVKIDLVDGISYERFTNKEFSLRSKLLEKIVKDYSDSESFINASFDLNWLYDQNNIPKKAFAIQKNLINKLTGDKLFKLALVQNGTVDGLWDDGSSNSNGQWFYWFDQKNIDLLVDKVAASSSVSEGAHGLNKLLFAASYEIKNKRFEKAAKYLEKITSNTVLEEVDYSESSSFVYWNNDKSGFSKHSASEKRTKLDLLFNTAELYAKAKDHENEARKYVEIASFYPKTVEGQSAVYKLALVYIKMDSEEGREKAAAVVSGFLKDYPGTKYEENVWALVHGELKDSFDIAVATK